MTTDERLVALEQALAAALVRITTYEAVIAHLSQDIAVLEQRVAEQAT